ncbi:MAG: hypothetical protein ACKVOO_02575 [Burkholderiaceae bacterium]
MSVSQGKPLRGIKKKTAQRWGRAGVLTELCRVCPPASGGGRHSGHQLRVHLLD